MNKIFWFLSLFFSLICLHLHALSSVNERNNSPRVEILTDNSQEFSFRIYFSDPEFFLPANSPANYFGIRMDGCYPSFDEGKPGLPVWNKLLMIPQGSRYEVYIEGLQTVNLKTPQQYSGMELAPVQPSRSKSDTRTADWVKDQLIYGQNDWYSNPFATFHDPGILRNTELVRLSLSPCSYHTGTRQLQMAKSAVVTVRFVPEVNHTKQFDNASYQSPFVDLSGFTLNQDADSQIIGQGSTAPVGYIILSDSMFLTTLQPFIQWKRRKGFAVTEVYKGSPGVGSTAASMKSYLQNLYLSATPANPAPTFLLIVGDVQQIPSFTGSKGSHPSDLYYAEYTGDMFPEMLYGRFSATTVAHLQAQIEKTLYVEQYQMTDPSYLSQAILVAGNDQYMSAIWANGHINYAQNEYINATNNLVPHTWLYPASIGQSGPIIQQFNQGASLVNYTAHGASTGWSDPSFTNTHIATLTNQGKYPLVISNACETNTFQMASCFGETLLRAENKGAVGHIGASNETFWDEDYHFAVGLGPIVPNPTFTQTDAGFYDRLFHSHGEPYAEWAITQSAIIMAGNLAVTQSGATRTHYYWEVYHLMGDPSLMPYLRIPSAMFVQKPMMLPTGLNQVVVQAPPYTYASVSANGVLHGAALTDPYGHALIHINPFTQPTQAELIITGQNLIPYIDTIQFVSPNGPFILADSVVLYDLTGNNNQKAEAGELIRLGMRLRNYTSFAGAPLTIRVINSSPYIALTDSVFTLPSLAGLSTWFSNGDLAFQVAPYVPDQHSVTIIVQVQQGTQTWNTPFNFIISSARLRIMDAVLRDPAGNNNSYIEPGEPFEVLVHLKNTGHADLASVQVELTHNSPWLQLISGSQQVPFLGSGQTSVVMFTGIAVNTPIPKGSVVKLLATAHQGQYADTLDVYKMFSAFREDFESNDFSSFQWNFTGSQPWFTTTVNPYEGTTCARSGAIPNQSSTTMSVTLPVLQTDSISFFYKVSSEPGYDFLRFRINQIEMGRWSGLQDNWQRAAYPVDSGLVTFSWSYEKDYYKEEGLDCAWIDYILFPAHATYIGMEEQVPAELFSLNIYPNPTHGDLMVEVHQDGLPVKGNLLLFAPDGRLVLNQVLPGDATIVHISGQMLPKGVFLLVVDTPAGVLTKRVIRM